MNPFMNLFHAFLIKSLATVLTLEWLFSCMSPFMNIFSVFTKELFATMLTLEWLFTCPVMLNSY